MKKKALALSLSLVMALCALAGCGSSTTPSTASSSGGDTTASSEATTDSSTTDDAVSADGVSAPGVYPIVEDKAEMSVFMTQVPSVTDYDDNRLTEWMEEQTNVHITWQLTAQNDREQKLNLMLASGENMTDVIMGGVPSPILIDYADQGIFVPLTNLIDTQAVNLQSVFAAYDGARDLVTAPDGEVYAMPNLTINYGNQYADRMFINQVWLDNLGLDMPTTTDEFAEVLRAFRDNDPNGNGVKDEIPMMGSTDGWNSSFDRYLMNSFIQYNSNDPYRIVDGVWEAVYDTDEYRNGLRYLNMLVSEGLYDTASFTQDITTFKKILENEGDALIGAIPSGGPTSFGTTGTDRKNEYVPIAPIKGPDGVQLAGWNPYNNFTLYTNTFVVTSSCENPAIAVKWADLLYEPETAKRARWGVPGVDYVPADPGGVTGMGEPAEWRSELPWGSDQNSHWAGYNPTLEDFAAHGQRITVDPTAYEPTNEFIARTMYMQYALPRDSYFVPMMYDVEASARMNEIKSILDPYLRQSREQFATGSMNIETDWEKYLGELEKMDYKELVEIMQTRYDQLPK